MAEYIEREAARDALYFADAITMRGVAIINQFPAADVKPVVRGEWVLDTLYPSGVKKFKCSICGHERTVHEKYEGIFRQNFCANCGADMRGHADEEN